jgi:hypothetical protein
MTAPLYWVTASRPLTDMVGLLVVVTLQGLIASARTPRALIVVSGLAGLGAGIRSQIVWLTVPLLVVMLVRHSERPVRTGAVALAAYAAAALAWAVPLTVDSGGLASYWAALQFQGADDFSGVTMLWTTPTARQLVTALGHTLVAPWGWRPLAIVVLLLAISGVVWLATRRVQALLLVTAAYAPYLMFHVIFQETSTTRYALPLVVPIAYLAVRGALALVPRFAMLLAGGLAVMMLAIAQPSLTAYAAMAAPAFRVISDMSAHRDGAQPPVLAMHAAARRPFEWAAPEPAFVSRLPTPARAEWLELVKYWNGGGRAPVWFVADPRRSDLSLIHHHRPRGSYRWPLRFHALIGGVRPDGVDWYELRQPSWYLGEGWALTPETAGLAAATGRGPGQGGSHGWVRRTADAVTLMVGGRHLPGPAATVRLTVTIDGRLAHALDVPPGFFLEMLRLPPGTLVGPGDYAPVIVTSDRPEMAIEQFDAQPAGTVVFGYGEGWHEHEFEPSTGRLWRWTSERAALRVRAEGHALAVRLRGETEDAGPSQVTLRVGGTAVARQAVDGAFVVTAAIPAAATRGDETVVTIETDRSYVPAESRWRSRDRRRLGLKIFECEITVVS